MTQSTGSLRSFDRTARLVEDLLRAARATAKAGCPISKVLKLEIDLDLTISA